MTGHKDSPTALLFGKIVQGSIDGRCVEEIRFSGGRRADRIVNAPTARQLTEMF